MLIVLATFAINVSLVASEEYVDTACEQQLGQTAVPPAPVQSPLSPRVLNPQGSVRLPAYAAPATVFQPRAEPVPGVGELGDEGVVGPDMQPHSGLLVVDQNPPIAPHRPSVLAEHVNNKTGFSTIIPPVFIGAVVNRISKYAENNGVSEPTTLAVGFLSESLLTIGVHAVQNSKKKGDSLSLCIRPEMLKQQLALSTVTFLAPKIWEKVIAYWWPQEKKEQVLCDKEKKEKTVLKTVKKLV